MRNPTSCDCPHFQHLVQNCRFSPGCRKFIFLPDKFVEKSYSFAVMVIHFFNISTVLCKKDQSEILIKRQTDFMHLNALGKKGQSAGQNCINCSICKKKVQNRTMLLQHSVAKGLKWYSCTSLLTFIAFFSVLKK